MRGIVCTDAVNFVLLVFVFISDNTHERVGAHVLQYARTNTIDNRCVPSSFLKIKTS